MSIKKKIVIWLAIIIAAEILIILCHQAYSIIRENRELHQKVDDLEVSLAHATIPLQRDTIHDSIPVVKQKVMTIDKTDYKKQVADSKLIKELRLKVSEIEAENDLLKSTRDTVILKPSQDSLLRYKDHWASFEYNTGTNRLSYAVRDSIITYLNRIPKHKFLWFRWGTKGYNVTHVNFNPHSEIEYNRFLLIEK